MSFYSKYQLERLLADGPAKTFRAVETSSGRPVFLHVFNPEGRLLFDTIAARFRDDAGLLKPPLIETGEFAGSFYAVTEILDPFVDLPRWVESTGVTLSAAPAPPPELRPVAGSSTKEPGEFTRMFALEQGATPPASSPPAPAPTAPPKKQPGAFTLEFMPRVPAPTAAQPAPSSQPTWPLAQSQQQAETAKAPEKQVWPARRPGPSSDISDLFNSMPPGEHIDVEAEQARAAQSAPPEGKPFRRAGTFTRMFGPGSPRKGTTQERHKTISSLFDSGIDVKPRAAKAPDQKTEDGPGEYTRMVAIPPQTNEPHPPPAQPIELAVPAAVPQGNRALVIAFIVIGALVITVIILAALLYSKR